jgi:hypothetical protein
MNTVRQGQGHRRTGTGMQTDRDTVRQGQGYRWTGAGTQRDRERDTNGQGQEISTLMDNLQKNKSVESVKF